MLIRVDRQKLQSFVSEMFQFCCTRCSAFEISVKFAYEDAVDFHLFRIVYAVNDVLFSDGVDDTQRNNCRYLRTIF